MMRGKWKIKELKVHWFCRNCWQRGTAGITLHPTSVDDEGFQTNPRLDIARIITTTCHTNCQKPDIRYAYEKFKLKPKNRHKIRL